MGRPLAWVTGAGGEMGTSLIPRLEAAGYDVVALDLVKLPGKTRLACVEAVEASILDTDFLEQLFRRRRPQHVYHLAAVLSAKAEREPELAHQVNVEGTRGLFSLCRESAGHAAKPIRFLFPSSIAVYGLPDRATKRNQRAVRETEWSLPSGMYGCNKLYCELLGSYLSRRARAGAPGGLDFRSIRFPGLISAETVPSSGTTDYAPAMIHAAARNRRYRCFVASDTRLPFMTMEDAVEGLFKLAQAEMTALSTSVYNIRGFSASAGEIREEVLAHFPDAEIDFDPQPDKQALVDTWPADIDDSLARRDWGLAPRHGLREALADYLIPALQERGVRT